MCLNEKLLAVGGQNGIRLRHSQGYEGAPIGDGPHQTRFSRRDDYRPSANAECEIYPHAAPKMSVSDYVKEAAARCWFLPQYNWQNAANPLHVPHILSADPWSAPRQMAALPPAHFEVAVVKPSRPDEKPHGGFKGDQVDVHAFTVKDLIDFAWTLNSEDSETIVGAPKWLDKARFDILGKVLVDAGGNGAQRDPQVDKDQLEELVRELLKDRFKIQAHIEERPITAYNLVAVRPKLKVADPSSRTRCVRVLDRTEKTPASQIPRSIDW